jgi:formylmethanofuran dehydrogenase subunit E
MVRHLILEESAICSDCDRTISVGEWVAEDDDGKVFCEQCVQKAESESNES